MTPTSIRFKQELYSIVQAAVGLAILYRFGRGAGSDGIAPRSGIGIGGPTGAPVRAVAAGTVALAGPFEGYGPTVILSHGGGYYTLYLYLRDVAVRARVRSIEAYSAHADRDELIAWIRQRQPIVGSLFLTHGEPAALEALRDALRGEVASIRIPAIGERYALAPGSAARRTATGRADFGAAIGQDWQNDYADFAVNLKRELQRIADEGRRRKALAAMRRILEEHQRRH